jgi:hypothetical protein
MDFLRIAAGVMACGIAWGAAASRPAELPRVFLDTAYARPTGANLVVPANGDLQAALDRARAGDQILLAPGATYTGNFVLPRTSPGGAVTHIRTHVPYGALPPEGTRMTPTAASALRLAKIVTDNGGSAITTAPGAANWRVVGVEITMDPALAGLTTLVRAGDHEQNSLDAVATHLVFDRVWMHGWPNRELRRALSLNSASTAVIDSWIADCHENGADSQAIAGWNGPGPYKIVNNHLEAAGENVMFGGGDPLVPGLVPSDIEIRGNHFTKPAAWKGVWVTVKNLFELKNAARVLVEGNVFSGSWAAAQAGFAINLKSVNQADAPWSSTRDVTIRYNRITNVGAGITISGSDENPVDTRARRLTVHDNIFDNVNVPGFEGTGTFVQLQNRASDVIVDHNTFVSHGPITAAALFDLAPAAEALTFTNNIVVRGRYGFKGSGTAEGSATLATYAPGAVFAGNAIVGGSAPVYPQGNFFPATVAAIGFADAARADYRLGAVNGLRKAGTGGRDVGADAHAVASRTLRAVVTP